MRSRLHVHVYCSATVVGWVQCQNLKGRGPISNFVSVKILNFFSNFVLLSLINIDCSLGVPANVGPPGTLTLTGLRKGWIWLR